MSTFPDSWRAKLSQSKIGKPVSEKARAILLKYAKLLKTSLKGEKNPRAILNADQVREIRRLYGEGNISQEKLGEIYGVKQVTISKIIMRVNWKHID